MLQTGLPATRSPRMDGRRGDDDAVRAQGRPARPCQSRTSRRRRRNGVGPGRRAPPAHRDPGLARAAHILVADRGRGRPHRPGPHRAGHPPGGAADAGRLRPPGRHGPPGRGQRPEPDRAERPVPGGRRDLPPGLERLPRLGPRGRAAGSAARHRHGLPGGGGARRRGAAGGLRGRDPRARRENGRGRQRPGADPGGRGAPAHRRRRRCAGAPRPPGSAPGRCRPRPFSRRARGSRPRSPPAAPRRRAPPPPGRP